MNLAILRFLSYIWWYYHSGRMSAIYFLHHDSAVVLTADDLVDDYLFQDKTTTSSMALVALASLMLPKFCLKSWVKIRYYIASDFFTISSPCVITRRSMIIDRDFFPRLRAIYIISVVIVQLLHVSSHLFFHSIFHKLFWKHVLFEKF